MMGRDMGSLAVRRLEVTASELAACSSAWQGRQGAVLTIGEPTDEACVLGAFQRASEIQTAGRLVRRGSGGGVASVGPGTVWLQLALPHVDALQPCPPNRILNRYVRPLLQGLTRATSVKASYFDRDWVSAKQHPIGLVAFAHEAKTNAAMFEAIIGVAAPFTPIERPSFLNKKPATLEEVAGRPIAIASVIEAIIDAYGALATNVERIAADPAPTAEPLPQDPPWAATREEAIGIVGSGPDAGGRLRIGGELMASKDAIERLEARAEQLPSNATADDVGRLVDEALTTRGAITFGVRSLASIRDVLFAARNFTGRQGDGEIRETISRH